MALLVVEVRTGSRLLGGWVVTWLVAVGLPAVTGVTRPATGYGDLMERSDKEQAVPEAAERQDRYPPDQQFGAAAARDQEAADRSDGSDGESAAAPRAGNKAEPER